MDHYRQGDILIRRVLVLPPAAQHASDPILAQGEATGHAHRLTGDGTVFRDPESQALYIQVMTSATVTHPEHGPITLGTGIYEVVRQREYTPEDSRFVSD